MIRAGRRNITPAHPHPAADPMTIRLLLLAVMLWLPLRAAAGDTLPFTLQPVGDKVYAAIDNGRGERGARTGANAGVVIGDDGVLVVDSFVSRAAAQALLAEVRKLTPLPVRFVVNTHYHLDHVAGNAVFREAGAVIVAQRNVRGWIGDNLKFFGPEPKAEERALVQAIALPQLGYDGELTLHLGTRRVVLLSLPGHTGGDTIVWVPDAGVAFAGDLFWRESLPNLIDATVADWIATLARLADEPALAAKVWVPGHGEVGAARDVAAFRAYLVTLRDAVAAGRQAGLRGDALVQSVRPRLQESHGGWHFFAHFADANIQAVEAELDGRKRNPVPAAGAR